MKKTNTWVYEYNESCKIHDDNNTIMKKDDMYKGRKCVEIEEVASRAQKKKGAEASEEDKYLGIDQIL